MNNAALIEGTEHVRVEADFINQQVYTERRNSGYVDTSDVVPNVFTKVLPYPSFSQLRMKTNMRDST